ncbi:hypothetical protein ACFSKI_03955 [Pseudogracilibacillus auburnensis]|uniref:Uncharacterized protein n=1 Tax=Pseudogracilibacillus auburnensis TaxID=1494959 RepID=A0A2V3W4D1_9BACI|nr:hypothetical protein [Pseudogracilibacillus auburnensis]PXW87938.1 hypothetical protein DFR56_10488 [Pseudogracilibacillus auburnensis]
MYERGEMSRFPLGINGREKYDVVYVGDVIPNYLNSNIPSLLSNDYVFLFSTMMLNLSEEVHSYGHVYIDLVRHDQLSNFNYDLRARGNYHVLKKEPLILNDFLELVPEETEQGIQITAHLKKQNLINKDYKVVSIKDFRILLVRENNHITSDNFPTLELGPEFQATIEHEKTKERYHYLSSCSQVLSGVTYRNKTNSKVKDAIEVVGGALDKDIENVKNERERAFNRYIDIRNRLTYIHKRHPHT